VSLAAKTAPIAPVPASHASSDAPDIRPGEPEQLPQPEPAQAGQPEAAKTTPDNTATASSDTAKEKASKKTEGDVSLSFSAPRVVSNPATGTMEVTSADGKRGFKITALQDSAQPSDVKAAAAPATGMLLQTDDAAAAYKQAQNSYVHEKYGEALEKFGQYLEQNPNAANAGDAQFWKAKSLMGLNRYGEAVAEFEKVRENWPENKKAPFAVHQEAVCLQQLGQTQRAVELFQQVARDYPSTPAADQAKRDLDKLRQ
jgi:tol-pal system protein YbgF